jgi:hydrogenase expression/formation protein HypC
MKILKKYGDRAEVKSGAISREVNIGLLKDIRVGDYVIVHAGFAIEKINEKHAKETLEILREMQP